MLSTKALISVALICVYVRIATSSGVPASQQLNDEFATCEEQLSKYRRFILQAIISFEDVCDAYSSQVSGNGEDALRPQESEALFFRNYKPSEQRSDIWAFFKLLMAQFNDIEFLNVIRDAVIERCHIKSQQQRDEKRNSVVLGKKQRFHSWGGKRASLQNSRNIAAYPEEHNNDRTYFE